MEAPYNILNNVSEIEQSDVLEEALDENEHQYSQLMLGLAAAIYSCDAQGYVRFYNRAAAELWGREPEPGKDLWCGSWKIFRPDGTPLSLDECPMAKTLKDKQPVRDEEIIIERPDGERRNVMPYPDPVFNAAGELVEAVNMLVDITSLKQKERALEESEKRYREIAEELEKRVEERTKDLKETNLELQRTNKELEEFAFIASHDMQEPLRKIKILTERLENNSGNLFDEVSKSYLDKIKSSSERMTNLINDILNYSRLVHLDDQFKRTDLNEVLQNVLSDFELSIEEKRAMISSDRLPVIKAIPLQMHQLFHNIISNSLKFCKDTIPCEIKISSQILTAEKAARAIPDTDFSYCEIIFKDNGIGFSQEFAENIFNIFERLHTVEKYKGTGIGLALCRKIVNIHRGKIFVESKVDEATAVHLILPLDEVKTGFAHKHFPLDVL